MFCEIVLAPERVHTFYESIRGGDLYLLMVLGYIFRVGLYWEGWTPSVYIDATDGSSRNLDRQIEGWIVVQVNAIRHTSADGRWPGGAGGEDGGKKINDWGLLLSMVDDEEDNHSSRIKQPYLEKVTYGAVVNFWFAILNAHGTPGC